MSAGDRTEGGRRQGRERLLKCLNDWAMGLAPRIWLRSPSGALINTDALDFSSIEIMTYQLNDFTIEKLYSNEVRPSGMHLNLKKWL
jgi:hypothetical protein